MSKRGSNSVPFAHENDALTARPQLRGLLTEVSLDDHLHKF